MKIIAYDLGTGGVKASLYDEGLATIAKSFIEYGTYYPAPMLHEQRPADWWDGVCASTRNLLESSGVEARDVGCVALSGHSLVSVPIGADGTALMDCVPIWSDGRAADEAAEFFRRIDERQWYMETGNGFPTYTYPLFKLMNMKKNEPDVFAKTRNVLGSKDYINYRLTGGMATDHSYASGSGGYSLKASALLREYWDAAGIDPNIFPDIVPSHTAIGRVTEAAARESGLATGTLVACGGVDNACMALGAVGPSEGRVFLSLGSSSWIPVNSREPILDFDKKPYVFRHIAEDVFSSAFSIFSGGSSLKWVRDSICDELAADPAAYRLIDELAEKSPVGAGGIFFNPSLAGGTSQDKSVNIRGAYIGLHLGTTKPDLARAALEGIAMNLKMSYDFMKQKADLGDSLLITGGGSKSGFWMQMFADVFGIETIKTNIDQDAASIGAAAIAARAVGLWDSYGGIDALHHAETVCRPDPERTAAYRAIIPKFEIIANALADIGDALARADDANPYTGDAPLPAAAKCGESGHALNVDAPLPAPKAVVFDMDGLMFDSERLAREGWGDVAKRHGIDIPAWLIDRTMGLKCSEIRSLFQEHFDGAGIDADAKTLHMERNELLLERVEREGAPVKSGLFGLLAHIRGKGLRTAVASAASPKRVETMLRKSGLTDAFDTVVTGGDVANGKPDPEIFLTAAARLGLSPKDCLALEDSANGVQAAAAAGMPVVMIPDSIEPTEEIRALAYMVLPTLNDVIPLIE
ncbi:MAG: HAD-IA family hydrolase [Clostridiales Family XIII bacterium]|jgi:xylulokinase|nr:HAD-IA family hydrolase [Clostridiales Family XIII bacterium]